jgi:hypothetical protein
MATFQNNVQTQDLPNKKQGANHSIATFGDQRDDDEGSKHLWNVGKLLPDYTAQQPRRQPS